MASSASIDLVQQAYIAYYGRAADQGGLDFWAPILDENGGDLSGIIDEFANSQEYADYLGDKPLEERLEAIYQNAFNREGDADGIAFWKTAIEDGTVTEAQASLAILQGATGDDVAVVNNKVAAAKNFTVTVTSSEADYNASNVTEARSVIAAVNGDAGTVNASVSATNGFVVRNGGELPEPGEVSTTFVSETVLTDENGENGASSMRLTGDQSVRVDFTDSNDQITGVDLDRDGVIEQNGLENSSLGHGLVAADHVVVDAYARNPINQYDASKNFLGDIYFDGTGFSGNGESTDGNIVLGGLGADTILGGIGNDFIAGGGVAQHLTGSDNLEGGRNADFFFVELSLLDSTDQPGRIDGGETADDTQAANADSPMDSDWLLLEASDDDEPVTIVLDNGTASGFVTTDQGDGTDLDEVENLDASGNLYGFLDSLNTKIGALAGNTHNGVDENTGIGSTAQLRVTGSESANIIVGGYDNDMIDGAAGNDILMGGNLHYVGANPNISGNNLIENNGVDMIIGGAGDDHVVFELDGGVYHGDAAAAVASTQDRAIIMSKSDSTGVIDELSVLYDLVSPNNEDDPDSVGDTLWLDSQVTGNHGTQIIADGVLRIDLRATGNGGQGTGEGTQGVDENGNPIQGNGSTSQSQTNSPFFGTVTGFENVIATGLGAIDYLAAGTNDPELNFHNQQNFDGVGALNLDLRGADGANRLYADQGNDIVEGRKGNDQLSGNKGNDLFIFAIDGDDVKNSDYDGDGVDVIHRQKDDDEDRIWDGSKGQFADGEFKADFGDKGDTTVENSSLILTLVDDTNPGAELENINVLSISSTIYDEDGDISFTLESDAILQAQTYSDLAAALTAAIAENPEIADSLVVTLEPNNTILITDIEGRNMEDQAANGAFFATSENNITLTKDMAFGTPEESLSQDRLIYKAYEDRADDEAVDDNATKGSGITLGDTGYAEDLVVGYTQNADGSVTTNIAESQKFDVLFSNLTTEDELTIKVNGVEFTLCVGKDVDGDLLDSEDTTQGLSQAQIQSNFLTRMNAFINSFMDDDTAAGQVGSMVLDADSDGLIDALQLFQVDYNGEEAVFMDAPEVMIENNSGGEDAVFIVTNTSAHDVTLLGFDGKDRQLNAENVLFWGDEGYIDNNGNAHNSRSKLETAPESGTTVATDDNGNLIYEGGVLRGTDAVVINAGDADIDGFEVNNDSDTSNDISEIVTDQGITVGAFNQTVTDSLDENFAVHGDDLLFGGAGNDIIEGGTGDDRIHVSAGNDVVDGGKNLYWVRENNQFDNDNNRVGDVEVLNVYEAAQRDASGAVTDVDLIRQLESESGPLGLVSGIFSDTLIAEQADFDSQNTTFTVILDGYDTTDREFKNDGAGRLITNHGDGTTSETIFTNFENIRTVSGTGLATAEQGQGRDTLDVQGMSDDFGGITYNLTNDNSPMSGVTLGRGAVWAGTGGSEVSDSAFDAVRADDNPNHLDEDGNLIDAQNTREFGYSLSGVSNAEYVINVDGVENVLGGDGADTLFIDETEAAKDNIFDADADGQDSSAADAVIYTNNFSAGAASLTAEPSVTFIVEASVDRDLVIMDEGRVGTFAATDTLDRTEFVVFNGNTARSDRENDVLDVTSQADGAVVDFVNSEIRDDDGNVLVHIGNMSEFEEVRTDGDDIVIVSDRMTNDREDVADGIDSRLTLTINDTNTALNPLDGNTITIGGVTFENDSFDNGVSVGSVAYSSAGADNLGALIASMDASAFNFGGVVPVEVAYNAQTNQVEFDFDSAVPSVAGAVTNDTDVNEDVSIAVALQGETSSVFVSLSGSEDDLSTFTIGGQTFVTPAPAAGEDPTDVDVVGNAVAGSTLTFGGVATEAVYYNEDSNEIELVFSDGVSIADVVSSVSSTALDGSVGDVAISATVGNRLIASEKIRFDSFLNYDEITPVVDGSASRLSLSDLRATNSDARIPDVLNDQQFTYDLSFTGDGVDSDTVDYSAESGTVAITLDFDDDGVATGDYNVMVDHNGDLDIDGGLIDQGDRIDLLKGVENVVASSGQSIIDLTNAQTFLGEDTTLVINFQDNENGTDLGDGTVQRTVLLQTESSTGSVGSFEGLNLLEVVDADDLNGDDDPNTVDRNGDGLINAADRDVAPIHWGRIEGSDANENVSFGDDHAGQDYVLNLRGGDNSVDYDKANGISVSIDNATTDEQVVVNVVHLDDEGNTAPWGFDAQGNSLQHTITSYTSNNPVASGQLSIDASRGQFDSINLGNITGNSALILGRVENTKGILDITFNAGEDNEHKMELVGFERIGDGSGNDVYTIDTLTQLGNLSLTDNATPDRDTLKLTNDGFGSVQVAGGRVLTITNEIDLDDIETNISSGGFDFSILDLSEVTNQADITAVTAEAREEIVVGNLVNYDTDAATTISGFETIWLSNNTVGSTFELDIDDGELQDATSAELLSFDSLTTLNASLIGKDENGDVVETSVRDLNLSATSTNGVAATIIGSVGNDTITGGGAGDTLDGGAGNDIISGGDDVVEIHSYTIDGAGGVAGNTITLDGFTVTIGQEVQGVVVAGNDADAIGAAFAREFAANPESFDNADDIESITYDSLTNAVLVEYTLSAGDVANNVLGNMTGVVADGWLPVAPEVETPYSGNGDDVIYGGQGIDTVTGGTGNDQFVVVGVVEADEYNTATGNAAKFADAKAAIEDGQSTSDISSDVFDGGEGSDTIEVWGTADFTATSIKDVENIEVNSEVTFTYEQLVKGGVTNIVLNDADSKVIVLGALDDGIAAFEGLFNADGSLHFTQGNVSILNSTFSTVNLTALNAVSVPENIAVGSEIADADATDSNEEDDLITYSITAGNGDGKFAIDPATGVITVAAALDFETTSSYTLTVQAEDKEGDVDSETFTVTVTDVEPEGAAPDLAAFTAQTIGANQAVASVATSQITDADSTVFTVSDDSALFDTTVEGDVVTVSTTGAAAGDYTINVTVTDDTGQTDTEQLLVTVTDTPAIDLNADEDGQVTATAEAEVFAFAATTGQVVVNDFDAASDALQLDLASASSASTLAELDLESDAITVQVDPFAGGLFINMGLDTDGNLISLQLNGVTDASLVDVTVI